MATIDKIRLNALTIKYLLGTLTAAEQEELDSILDQDRVFRLRFEERVDKARLKDQLSAYLDVQARQNEARQNAAHETSSRPKAPVHILRRYLPYAAAVLLIAIGLWFYRHQPKPLPPEEPVIAMEHEILPGADRAKLTLSDGTVIDLDSAGKGLVSKQADVNIIKTDSGAIAYRMNSAPTGRLAYNVVSTPRGGTYKVALPDGSNAWLNAASSIRFPTAFEAGRREVEVTGEVYFDITADPKRPFHVSSGGAAVQVLGTEFDIQNYNNEPAIQVTLVKGSVKVQSGKQDQVLSAGQQARLTAETPISIVDQPDIDQAIAWKTGFFKFKNADIRSIMRAIERWYDVDVEYQITDYSVKYGGRVSRDLPLSQLLRLLQGNNIHHYKMEGHKLIVLP